MDRSGQVLLGKYELTRMLGKGGMGEVWEGEHQLTGRRVAVKILSDAYLSNRKVVARFGREARAASAVQHDGIVEILDQDSTSEGVPFLVMEFLEGESVGQRIKRRGKLGENEALAIMLPLLEALDAAHQAGVIHRDLKPDNVFILPGVRGDERIKILDFGISQKADEIEHRLTQEGSVLGTPHYMSPEQARGESNIDVRVDVYAAAVMFYECVAGQVPFDAGNYNALLQIIISRPPVPPRARGAQVSAAIELVVMAALAKKRDERPPNARVLRELFLEAGLQDERVQLEPKTWKFRSVPQDELLAESPTPSVPSLAPRPAPKVDNPFELEADLFKPAPGTGGFALPRSSRHIEPAWAAPAPVPAPPLPKLHGVPPPVPKVVPSLPGLDLSRPLAPLTLDTEPRGAGGRSLPSLELAEPPRGGKAAAATFGRPIPVQRTPRKRVEEEKSSPLGTVLRWLSVIAAIALLGYFASTLFARRDLRKPRRDAAQDSGETAPTR